jgi:D-alanyl-lipoteichoic acid acyltransferase DltB (MBOAT superfamily)
MLFNSFTFLFFFIIVFFCYWFIFSKKLSIQNAFIAVASFYFYGTWDWRFLLLLILSLIVDFSVGYLLDKTELERKRKALIVFSVFFNLGLLCFFKYFNFFIDTASTLLTHLGFKVHLTTLNIILPVGISFYTFQSLSYTIEVYRKQMSATKDIISYAAFISFFPQLVAGPIERARNMLPQFQKNRLFNYNQAVQGVQLILWGLFKKVVVADLCSEYVNASFGNYVNKGGMELILSAVYFAFQIYGDFSGYTDVARGLAKMFGIEFIINFRYPYFSRDIAEFWRRWHISLSSWFRDYLYLPLGGSRVGKWTTVRNTFIVFLVSGFWHGANFTFIIWGLLHAIYYMPLLLANANRNNLQVVALNTSFPSVREILQMFLTFSLVVLAWIFFRADSLQQAFGYIHRILVWKGFVFIGSKNVFPLILFTVIMEWIGRKQENTLETFVNKYRWAKLPMYFFLGVMIYSNFSREQSFIYFQF